MRKPSERAHREAVVHVVDQMLLDIGFGGLVNRDELIAIIRGQYRAWKRLQSAALPPGDVTIAELAYEARHGKGTL